MRIRYFLMPSLIRLVLAIYIVSIVAPTALSQQKKQPELNIAVFDFDARGGVTKEEAASLSDIFQAQLVEFGEFNIVDRSRIKTILQEQGFQQSEVCSQVECIVEAGKILKVERMFAGTVGKIGNVYNVNIQLIDIATGQIIQNKSRQKSGDIDELATDIVPEMAKKMVEEMTGKEVTLSSTSSGTSWGWYLLGGVVVAGCAAAVVILQKNDQKKVDQTTPQGQLPDAPVFP